MDFPEPHKPEIGRQSLKTFLIEIKFCIKKKKKLNMLHTLH